MKHYILDGHEPVPEPDIRRFGEWFESANRRVALTELADGAIHISTVFLGYDPNFLVGPPLVFETMVFFLTPNTDQGDDLEDRYATWAEAEAGHAKTVEAMRMKLATQSVIVPGPEEADPASGAAGNLNSTEGEV